MKKLGGILKIASYFLAAVITVSGWVWVVAVDHTRDKFEGKELRGDLNKVIRIDSIRNIRVVEQNGKIDSIMIDIKELKADFKDFANVKTSWENWMYIHKDKDDLTEKVFVDYMQNLGFDLKKNLESNDDKTVSDK